MVCLGTNRTLTGGPYFDTIAPGWSSLVSASCSQGSQCAPPVSGCGGSPSLPPCTRVTVTFVGLCNGVQYTLVHVSCCEPPID